MKINDIIINESLEVGDGFSIEVGDLVVESSIVGFTNDGVIVEADNKALTLLHLSGALFEAVTEDLSENVDEDNPVARSIIRRIMNQRQDLLQYGPKRLLAAVDEVADFVGDVEEIGSSDVSGWVKHVEQMLRDNPPEAYDMREAKYRGREVPLGKPMKGDVAKSKVYVKGPKGNVVKVNFGDKTMRIKKSNPKRRKSFRARHNCANPGPRWKARYWSCRAW
jgi:hypothetical protein